MSAEWIIIHSRARTDIRSGANIGLQFFARRLERHASVRYVTFFGATWKSTNKVARMANKIASALSSIGAGISLYRQSGPHKIAYQNAFSGYFAALRTIAFARIALSRGCARCILHVRNGNLASSRSWQLYCRFLSRHADRIVMVAQYQGLADRFAEAGFSTHVLRNIIDEPSPVHLGPRGELASFCFLGTRFESKGVLDFLKAGRELAQSVPIRVYIAGPSVSPAVEFEIKQLMQDQSAFRDLGVLDRTGVESVLGAAHYIVLPTRYEAESMPRVLVEAISMGCVPIATDHAGIRDEMGAVSIICDLPQLEDTLRHASDMVADGNWMSKSRAARAYYQENFSPRKLDEFVTMMEQQVR